MTATLTDRERAVAREIGALTDDRPISIRERCATLGSPCCRCGRRIEPGEPMVVVVPLAANQTVPIRYHEECFDDDND